jgi:hypothetical protein
VDVGHQSLLSHFFLAGLAKTIKIQLMIGHLISCRLHDLPRPIGDLTELEFAHIATSLADDMVMVIL